MPRGKKICPVCGIENGVRTLLCGCGHRFSVKQYVESKTEDIKDPQKTDLEDQKALPRNPLLLSKILGSSISNPLIQTPAGRCPIKPQGFVRNWPDGPASEDSIAEWSLKVFSSGNYLPDAVVYWIHEFWDMNLNNGADYKRVKSIVIKTLCGTSDNSF